MTSRFSLPIRIGVVGLGMASTPHLRALADLSDGRVAVRAVFALEPVRRAEVAKTHGFPAVESLDDIVDDPSIDAVLLLTPPNARAEIVARLAAAGKPILMEKPIERTTPAALAIVETMERAGLPLAVMLQHRLKPASLAFAALLASGRLGRPALVRLDVPWWRPQSYYDVPGRGSLARDGGGVLISQAIHTLDLMLTLFGPVADVQALAGTTSLHRMETEDIAVAGLRFRSGAFGAVTATTAAYPGEGETLAVSAERGSATLRAGSLTIAWHDGTSEVIGEPGGTGAGADPMAFDHGPHRAVIADFVAALTEGRAPAITGRSALAVHHLIDAILASARAGLRVKVAADHA